MTLTEHPMRKRPPSLARTKWCWSPAATCASPPTSLLARPGGDGGRSLPPPWPRRASPCAGGIPLTRELEHGFICSQRMGMEVFKNIDPDAPLIVAEAVWQYSHHVLAGLRNHRGPDPHRRQLEPASGRAWSGCST